MTTEVLQHPVNIRKRRIMEALKDESSETTISCLDLTTPKELMTEEEEEEETTPPPPPTSEQELTVQKLVSTDKDDMKILDMKLTILENWELSKRTGIEKLVKEVEQLQEMEDQVDKIEELLTQNNIEINEEEFEKFFQKQLAERSSLEPMDLLNEPQPQTPKRQEHQTKRVKISATSTPITRKPAKTEIADKFEANEDGMVVIGPNGTLIAKSALQAINWNLSGAALTRKILMEVFGRETLAFHTLTGKPSPAFMDCDKPMKNQLDPLKVADIIHLVMQHTELTAKEVRNAITTKCADENKMFRQREKKRLSAASKLQQQEDN